MPNSRATLSACEVSSAEATSNPIEQVLTGWIFGLLDEGEDSYDSAKAHIVQTICGGLAA